ncbi:MAG: hypothetical protein JJ975_06880 [Bacteroidia bacterium]|nr:hypothetical protein [Bacteroidia bacterium]
MKVLTYFSGIFSISTSTIGALFFLMHWKGASIILVLGLSTMALFFVPLLGFYLYHRHPSLVKQTP